MNQPDWAQLLAYLYNNHGYYYVSFSELDSFDAYDDITRNEATLVAGEKLRQEMNGIGAWDMGTILNLLYRTELVRIDIGKHGILFRLTKDGFDVGHERELRKKQQRLIESQTDATDTLADFTIILGVTALIQALAVVITAPRYSTVLSVVYLAILGILFYNRDEWFHGV